MPAGRPAEGCDEAELHRVTANAEHDRNGRGRLLCRHCRRYANRDQHRRRKPNQLRGECRQAIRLPLGKAVLDRDISADDEARLFQSLQKRGPERCVGLRGAVAEISDDRQARLRRGPERRKRGRAADQREELAAFHYSMTSVARASTGAVTVLKKLDGGLLKRIDKSDASLGNMPNIAGCKGEVVLHRRGH